MNTWNERLAYALDKRKKRAADLRRAVAVTAPSVSAWLSGETKMLDGANAWKVCSYLRIHHEWLFHGSGLSGLDDDDSVSMVRHIPVMTYDQATGIDDGTPSDTIPVSDSYGDDVVAIQIHGHDMEPEFKPGEIVIVDKTADIKPGSYVLAVYGGHGVFRKLKVTGDDEFMLAPLNQDYPTIHASSDNCKITGAAINHIRSL